MSLPSSEKLLAKQNLQIIAHLDSLISELEGEVYRISTQERWEIQVAALLQITGIGVLNAMKVLAAIGDISRFDHEKKLVGYRGLYPSVKESDNHKRWNNEVREKRA